jgi:hypothetical protein
MTGWLERGKAIRRPPARFESRHGRLRGQLRGREEYATANRVNGISRRPAGSTVKVFVVLRTQYHLLEGRNLDIIEVLSEADR